MGVDDFEEDVVVVVVVVDDDTLFLIRVLELGLVVADLDFCLFRAMNIVFAITVGLIFY